ANKFPMQRSRILFSIR
ncbi:hypothetical protein CP061683_0313B, partial [Chlamydia psittaci 06-1683]